MFRSVGLDPVLKDRAPHEFSGGQRQRLCIASALASDPSLIICDEPISALDVSIQSQIINLLIDLQGKRGLSYLFIAHDLSVVRHVSDRIVVMYLGNVVEISPWSELYERPLHPYTKALLSAIPIPDPIAEKARKRTRIEGEVPSLISRPSGCVFHPRCPFATDMCRNSTCRSWRITATDIRRPVSASASYYQSDEFWSKENFMARYISSVDYSDRTKSVAINDWLGTPPEFPAIDETLEADVIVCGAGLAGVAAARAAVEGGATVLIFEKCGGVQFRSSDFGVPGRQAFKTMGAGIL